MAEDKDESQEKTQDPTSRRLEKLKKMVRLLHPERCMSLLF